MGGQLIKGYALEGDSQGVTGLTKAWKLYRGHKAQTHSLASIFLIEKKQLKKSDKEDTIKVAKKEASSLLRVRHPGVLAVVEPLTEDENILAFVTERVEGNIAQLIKSGKMTEFLNSEL
jgi:SCY1-like protein 2